MTLKKKDLPPRVARWALLLEEFDYDIEHRPGTSMKHVDALSRYPVTLNITDTTTIRIKKAQGEDTKINLIKKILEKESYDNFILRNGIVYKDGTQGLLLVITKKMQMEIIKNSQERGHVGVTKTKELINREYYIENIDGKIKKCINNCIECI